MKLLGIPYIQLGLAALVIAVLWVFIWPHKRNVKPGSLPHFILRWFHALVWLLLAAAAIIASSDILGGGNTAQLVAFLGLIIYPIFITTVVTIK